MKNLFEMFLKVGITTLVMIYIYLPKGYPVNNNSNSSSDTTLTSDSASWLVQFSGTNKNLNAVSFIDENHGWAVGDSGVVLKTNDGGETWVQQTTIISSSLFDVCFIDGNHGWAAGDYKTILKTDDGGVTWIVQSGNKPNYNFLGVSFTNLNDGIIVGNYGLFKPIILKTTNGGTDWIEESKGANGSISDITFSNEYIGTAVGQLGTILRTTDGGDNWINQSNNNSSHLIGVDFINSNDGMIVGEGGSIFKTTDGGINWLSLTSNVTNILFDVSCIDSLTATVVGENGIILKTTNGGLHWNQQPSETTNWLRGLYYLDSNKGWAVGDGGIILHTTNGGVTFLNSDDNSFQPKNFKLYQNYPNPFNPSTNIQYRVFCISNVSLKVYDVLGNEVATLVNEEKPAGSYEVKFNAAGLSSGIYFYKLQAGNLVETKKMVLMK